MKSQKLNLFKAFSIIFFTVLLCVLVYFYIQYIDKEKEFGIKKYFDFNNELLLNAIEEVKLNVLTVSLLLSNNSDIKSCAEYKEQSQCRQTLKTYIETLQNIPLYKNALIHIHSNDFKSIARSWNSDLYGDDLSSFRYTLLSAKTDMKSLAGIEAGRCGIFSRGISPIIIDGKFSGSIEVITDFEYLYKLAKSQGYNLFILVDKKYLTDCFFAKNDILKDYIILNQDSANLNVATLLDKIDISKKTLQKKGSDYFYSKPFNDVNNNNLGYLVMHINEDVEKRSFSTLDFIFK